MHTPLYADCHKCDCDSDRVADHYCDHTYFKDLGSSTKMLVQVTSSYKFTSSPMCCAKSLKILNRFVLGQGLQNTEHDWKHCTRNAVNFLWETGGHLACFC